jgi:hypothetical protein
MSALLLKQIDEALTDVRERERASRMLPVNTAHEIRKKDAYEAETRQMRWDCYKAQQWLRNCKQGNK